MLHTLLNWSACYKCISFCVPGAAAHWDMIKGLANGRTSAISGAHIAAFALNACLVSRTVRVKYTFWPTPRYRIPMKLGQTFADTTADALCVNTTQETRVILLWDGHSYKKM